RGAGCARRVGLPAREARRDPVRGAQLLRDLRELGGPPLVLHREVRDLVGQSGALVVGELAGALDLSQERLLDDVGAALRLGFALLAPTLLSLGIAEGHTVTLLRYVTAGF